MAGHPNPQLQNTLSFGADGQEVFNPPCSRRDHIGPDERRGNQGHQGHQGHHGHHGHQGHQGHQGHHILVAGNRCFVPIIHGTPFPINGVPMQGGFLVNGKMLLPGRMPMPMPMHHGMFVRG